MAVRCKSCNQWVAPSADGRLPPWCSACGVDLKSGSSDDAPESPAPALGESSVPPTRRVNPQKTLALQSLMFRFGLLGGIVGGMVVPPMLQPYLPRAAGGFFDLNQLFVAVVTGGLCALLGAGVGMLIENPNEKAKAGAGEPR